MSGIGNVNNLKPFPKGTSGNPGGRPGPRATLARAYRDLIAAAASPDIARVLELPAGSTTADAIAIRLVRNAIYDHSVSAIRELGRFEAASVDDPLSSVDESTPQPPAAEMPELGEAAGGR